MKILIKNSTIHILNMLFKDTHREKAPSNKTQAFTKSMSMDIWVVGTLNLVFVRGSYNSIKFSKKIKEFLEKRHSFCKVNFVLPILFVLTSVFSKVVLYGNVALPIIVLSSKKHCSSLLTTTGNINSWTKGAPETYLEPRQTSLNKIICVKS